MGPWQADAGVAALAGAVVLAAVLLAVLAVRARRRRAADDDERGPDDTAMRPEVLDNLHRLTTRWDGGSDPPPEPPLATRTSRREPVPGPAHGGSPTGPARAAAPTRHGTVLRGVLLVLVVVALAGAVALWLWTH